MASTLCPECGREIDSADVFCMFCGFSIKEDIEEDKEVYDEKNGNNVQPELSKENDIEVENISDAQPIKKKKKRFALIVILAVAAVLMLSICVSCAPVLQKIFGVYDENSVVGTWKVTEVLFVDEGKSLSDPALSSMFSARFYRDMTGYMEVDGEKTEIIWAYEQTNEMGIWYRIYMGSECTYGMIATDPEELYYGCLVYTMDRDLIMVYEKN